jgi:hypothetical protein
VLLLLLLLLLWNIISIHGRQKQGGRRGNDLRDDILCLGQAFEPKQHLAVANGYETREFANRKA